MKITIVRGDITRQPDVDAIVNAARPSLLGGGGVDGAIHRAAGPKLGRACGLLPVVDEEEVGEATRYITAEPVRCPVGEARVTPAFNLAPVKYLIHTVGPKYNPEQPDRMKNLLAAAYGSSLMSAVDMGCRTVALPAISCGVYAFPIIDAAEIALTVATRKWDLDEIRFVLFEGPVFEAFTEYHAFLTNAETTV
jgi:O-acetyl-ADP-ribose deacetylase (regulator of RNase III)